MAFPEISLNRARRTPRAGAWRFCPRSESSRSATPATRLHPPAIQHSVTERQRYYHLFCQGSGHFPRIDDKSTSFMSPGGNFDEVTEQTNHVAAKNNYCGLPHRGLRHEGRHAPCTDATRRDRRRRGGMLSSRRFNGLFARSDTNRCTVLRSSHIYRTQQADPRALSGNGP